MALVGVVIMNYHGYLNGTQGSTNSFAERVFNPTTGVLTTRFAATFVVVAGVGVALLTTKYMDSKEDRAMARWRLIRRGLLLYAFGYFFNWIWPGTILLYYGAMFMIAAVIFTLRTRMLVIITMVSVLVAAALRLWRVEEFFYEGNTTQWLTPWAPDTPRNLLFNTFINGTHPLFPWLAFLMVGMIIGRNLNWFVAHRKHVAIWSVAILAATYALANWPTGDDYADIGYWRIKTIFNTDPADVGVLYSVGTAAVAVLVLSLVASACHHRESLQAVIVLQRVGQMTLTLYILHALIFNFVVHHLRWVDPTGLDTALVFSAVVLVPLALFATWWKRFIGNGPAETLYRKFGG